MNTFAPLKENSINLDLSVVVDGLQNNIFYLRWYRAFIMSNAVIIPTIVLFWQSAGLSFQEIFLLQAIFAFAIVIFEVPSGFISDIIGRKLCLVAAALVYFFTVAYYPFGKSFWEFSLIEIFLALALSLVSGTDQALLYDSLLILKKDPEFSDIWGQIKLVELIGSASGAILGGLIIILGQRAPFLVAVSGFLLAFFFSLFLTEPPRQIICQTSFSGYCHELYHIAIETLKNKRLRWVILLSASLLSLVQVALWYYQPYFTLCGIKLIYFGIIFALYNVTAGVAAKYSSKFERYLALEKNVLVLIFFLSLSYLLLGTFVFWGGFLFGLIHQILRGSIIVSSARMINDETNSYCRATVASIQSLITRLIYGIFLVLAGWLTDKIGILASFKVLALITISLGGIIFVLKLFSCKGTVKEEVTLVN